MCRLVALDHFQPRAFVVPGRRLAPASILFLALCSGALLAVFGEITDRLIPLFAVGVFLAITMSRRDGCALVHGLHRDAQRGNVNRGVIWRAPT
jgi:hypothetical protein